MNRICQARITREYKTRKADSVWPEVATGPILAHLEYPPCNGTLTYKVRAVSDGCPCCSGSPEVELEMACSRCKSPYTPGILRFQWDAAGYLTDQLNDL